MKKIVAYTIAGALTIGLSSAAISVFAEENVVSLPLTVKYDSDLETVDEPTRQKVAEIHNKLLEGTITFKEAEEQLTELGVGFPLGLGVMSLTFADEKDALISEMDEQLRESKITAEEAKEQLSELGEEMPASSEGGRQALSEIDEETTAKIAKVQKREGTVTAEEVKQQLLELGVKMSASSEGDGKMTSEMDEEIAAKVAEIQERLREGKITAEEAEEQLSWLLTFQWGVDEWLLPLEI